MKKNLLMGTVFVLCGLVVAGCNHGSDDNSSNPSTDSTGNGQNTLAAALEADYSNMTVSAMLSYDMMGMGIEEEYFTEYVYKGYTIIDTGDVEDPYMFYHDYQGESYLYFEDNYGTGDAWLNKGMSDAALGLENTYFSMEYSLKYLNASDAVYASGFYIISDPEVVQTLNTTMFYFAWFNDIEYIMINVNEGYITQIIGLCSIDNDEEFVKIQLGYFGETTFYDASLPPAPNANNVKTYYEYTGTTPTPDIYIESLKLDLVGSVLSDETADVILDLEKTAEVAVSYLPEDANHKDLIWHTTDDKIVEVTSNMTSGHRTLKAVGVGTAEIYVTAQGENGLVTSNSIKVRVNPLQQQNKEDCVYDFTFANVLEDGTVLANNKVETNATHVITSNRAGVRDGKYSTIFEPTKQILYLDPLSTDFSKPSGAEVVFNFDDQQVSSISFYYGLMYSSHKSYINRISSAKIMTSNDGVTWAEIDILPEIQENISSSYKKLMEHEFEPASIVKIRLESNMVGNQYFFCMDDMAFMANDKCHMHEDAPIHVPVESITVSSAVTTLKVGDTANFGAAVLPINATNKNVTWMSSNEAVATINENGVVTALSAGTSEIYAVSNGEEAIESNHVTITVEERPHLPTNYVGTYFGTTENSPFAESKLMVVDVDHANVEIEGTTYHFIVDSYDADDRFYIFKGLDNEEHTLRLKLTEFSGSPVMEVFGTCGDYVFGNNYTNNGSEFALYVAATSIEIRCSNPDNKVIVGQAINLYAQVVPTNAYYRELTRSVSDSSIADFESDESDRFVGKKAGTVTVTFTNQDGVSNSITIVVEDVKPVTAIQIVAPKTEVEVGESMEVVASITPTDYNVGSFTWSSSDTEIATVKVNSTTGVVTITGKAVGTCVITCTDMKSNVTGSIEIQVVGASSKIPAEMVGTWTATEPSYFADFTFVFDEFGNLTWSENFYSSDIELTLVSQAGNTYTFANDAGDTFTFTFDGTTLMVTDFMDASLGFYYFDSEFECTR